MLVRILVCSSFYWYARSKMTNMHFVWGKSHLVLFQLPSWNCNLVISCKFPKFVHGFSMKFRQEQSDDETSSGGSNQLLSTSNPYCPYKGAYWRATNIASRMKPHA